MPELSILTVLQAVVGLGILNVWLLRPASETGYRGGGAKTLKGEFREYGLPGFAFYVVGSLKVAAGVIFIAGLWIDLPVRAAGAVVGGLMLGAIAMHLKVGDPPVRSMPAALVLLMCAGIVFLA